MQRTSVRVAVLCVASIVLSFAVHGATSTVTISGAPVPSVFAGQAYNFSPRATVLGSGAPQFAIQNKPRWASFSAFSGRLSGVPTRADAGLYGAIRISISDGTSRAELRPFSIVVNAGVPQATRSVSLRWRPPTENLDDSALTDLAGYRIYSGSSDGKLKPLATLANPSLSRYVVEEVAPGEHFFAITALNSAGRESPPSEIVSARVD